MRLITSNWHIQKCNKTNSSSSIHIWVGEFYFGAGWIQPIIWSWNLDGSCLTLDGRKVEVESLCHVVASADGLYSSSFSPLLTPGGLQTLSTLGLVNLGYNILLETDLLTWVTFRRYWTPSASTRTLLPFFRTTVNGGCFYVADSFFFLLPQQHLITFSNLAFMRLSFAVRKYLPFIFPVTDTVSDFIFIITLAVGIVWSWSVFQTTNLLGLLEL